MSSKQIPICDKQTNNMFQLNVFGYPFCQGVMPYLSLQSIDTIQSRGAKHHHQEFSDMLPKLPLLHHHRIVIPRDDKEDGDGAPRDRAQQTAPKMNPHHTKRRKAFHDIKTAGTRHAHTTRFHIARGNARNLFYHKNKNLSVNKLDGKGVLYQGTQDKKSASLRLSCLEALRKPYL